ncbi:hypothetical protein [Moraxella lacunata]|uniref:hypothetical protein n=1 Tax=Moraxella lacunata TaxID=477 RepID=UPI003EE31185
MLASKSSKKTDAWQRFRRNGSLKICKKSKSHPLPPNNHPTTKRPNHIVWAFLSSLPPHRVNVYRHLDPPRAGQGKHVLPPPCQHIM